MENLMCSIKNSTKVWSGERKYGLKWKVDCVTQKYTHIYFPFSPSFSGGCWVILLTTWWIVGVSPARLQPTSMELCVRKRFWCKVGMSRSSNSVFLSNWWFMPAICVSYCLLALSNSYFHLSSVIRTIRIGLETCFYDKIWIFEQHTQ